MKKLALLILILAAPALTRAMTLSDIRTEIRLRVKDVSTSGQRYTDAQINNMINEGQRDVNNNTWVCMKSTSITLVVGTTYYALPSDLIAILRVTRERKLLSEVTLAKNDSDFAGGAWENSGGVPRSYFQDMAQPENIGIYPYPTSPSTGTLSIQYIAQGATLSSDSDVPFLSKNRYLPYHDLLVFYACYRIYLIEGEVDKTNLYRQEYESRLKIMHDVIGRAPNYLPGFTGGVK